MMDRATFRAVRDAIALDTMLTRGRALETRLASVNTDIRRIKDELARYPAPPGGLNYNLTRAQFDERIRIINIREKLLTELDAAQRVWAGIDAAIGDIVRDSRYQEWAASQQQEAG